ncbi:cell division initiation protein [Clostridium sp. CAG:433]|nr:DivIVA domain-containing protein [Bacilli bacterium]CDD28811.1 cell division initiation protein [Clostridium sp. CAG:433]HCJ32634.1 DivIVA domain-containing protein [Bacillota bacterium]
MSKEILLNPDMLYNWDFKVDARGYRPQEVDKVLDMVISDYNAYNSMIREKDRQIDALNNQILELKQKLRNAKANMDIVKNSERQVTNVDLLRRISELEKIIYGRNNDNE